MKTVKWSLSLIFAMMTLSFSYGQNKADTQVIKQLLHTFLAEVNSKQMHDRFWHQDLVYTSSSGKRFGKSQIMSGFDGNTHSDQDDESISPTYKALDIDVKIIEKVAILNFTLVQKSNNQNTKYLNSGTLIKEENSWRVINWQATKIPEE